VEDEKSTTFMLAITEKLASGWGGNDPKLNDLFLTTAKKTDK